MPPSYRNSKQLTVRLQVVTALANRSVCGSTRLSFVKAFEKMILSHINPVTGEILNPFPSIQRLSLHGCQTLPAHVYPKLLPLLPRLTHLVCFTIISMTATNRCIGSEFHTSKFLWFKFYQLSMPTPPLVSRKLWRHYRSGDSIVSP
jgi:hypothetical protein